MKATFDNTVSILVKAFLEGTLLKGDCRACAVGNICATALGTTVKVTRDDDVYEDSLGRWAGEAYPQWDSLFVSAHGEQHRRYEHPKFKRDNYAEAFAQVDATGYSVQELARIEQAFESAHQGYNEEAEFAGLMAVVDVLADIHSIDLATAEASKLLFVKA